MGLADGLRSIKAKLTKATATVTDEISALRRQIRDRREDLKRAGTAPIPLAEAEARARGLVSELGAAWLAAHGPRLLRVSLDRARALAQRGKGRTILPFDLDGAVPFGAVCAADPAGAERLLVGLLRATSYEAGSPSAERPAAIAQLEAELAELERVEEGLVDDAAAAGLAIGHRPEVLARRQREARRHELARQGTPDVEQRQAGLDAQHAEYRRRSRMIDLDARKTSQPSAYIASGGTH